MPQRSAFNRLGVTHAGVGLLSRNERALREVFRERRERLEGDFVPKGYDYFQQELEVYAEAAR